MMENKPSPARDSKIDVIKGLFVIGMVWSHVCGYTGARENPYVDGLWNILAVVTFSGFIFCMGYVFYPSYFAQETPPVVKMLRSIFRTMTGYFIAAVGYFVIFKDQYDWQTVKSVLMLQKFGSISEFLLAFALIPLVTIPLTVPIKKYILPSDTSFALAIFLLLMTALIPVERVTSPYLALFIGSEQGIYYPVLQYYVFFLLGAYSAARRVRVGLAHLGIGLFCLLIFVALRGMNATPSRFPPSLAWITLGGGIFFLWYWVSERLARLRPFASVLVPIGANALFFFVASDILIFGIGKAFNGAVGVLGASALAFVVLAVIYAMMIFVRPVKG